MADLDEYDYEYTTTTDWDFVILMIILPAIAMGLPMFTPILMWINGDITNITDIKSLQCMGIVYFGAICLFGGLGYVMSRGCPQCGNTIKKVERMPVYGQKKKVLK